MRIDRRLTILGVMLVVLSMTMATQYATTKVQFQFDIVHPSNADIRFIGRDNSSDGSRVIRSSTGSNGTNIILTCDFGDWNAGTNKTYTCAFGIVNEEPFAVNITHINVSLGAGTPNVFQIWLHGDPNTDATSDSTAVFVMNKNTTVHGSSTGCVWTLARGDQNKRTMNHNVTRSSTATTMWDTTSYVQYIESNSSIAQNCTNKGAGGSESYDYGSDYVWVQISLDIPSSGFGSGGSKTGRIWLHFEANTHVGDDT